MVDASVWSILADPGERFHADARRLLLDSDLPLAALDLTLFEIANAVGVKMGRPERARWISEIVVSRCAQRLRRVDPDLVADALNAAVRHGLTAYDAAYVAAARRHGMTLVSADVRDLVSRGLAVTPDAALYP
ncbi:MAG TPA: PIN domain-containing protein [Solirubrobacterales bacterium]|nr:PIN domain-containing protein [Solirubrobacterales bacterium]